MNGVKTIFQAIPTFLPKLVPVGVLLIGLILGFLWAYRISPNIYTAAEPVNLGTSWKQEYVKQIAWQYAASGDAENAKRQLASLGDADKVLQDTLTANQADPNLTPRLLALQPFAAPNDVQLAKIRGGLLNSDLTPVLCVIALAIVASVLVLGNSLRTAFAPPPASGSSTVVTGQEAVRRKELQKAQTQKTDFAADAMDRGKPVAQFMSTYLLNDDVYDDSFSIENAAGEFLGETGAGISKTLGTGSPKRVTAFEAWVFDKNDIKTVTKVLMSEYAYKDDAIRAELAPKGEAVLVKPGMSTTLETTTLSVQVRVVDTAYGSGATGDNSFFERFTLEIAAWPKAAPAAGIPDPYAGTERLTPAPAFNPPPVAPRPAVQQPPAQFPASQPPPASPFGSSPSTQSPMQFPPTPPSSPQPPTFPTSTPC